MAEQDGDLSWTELVGFLTPETRKDILVVALRYIHGISDAASLPHWLKGDGSNQSTLATKLVTLLSTKQSDSDIVGLVLEIMVNFSGHESFKSKFLTAEFLQFVTGYISQVGALLMELFGVLSNLTIADDDLKLFLSLLQECRTHPRTCDISSSKQFLCLCSRKLCRKRSFPRGIFSATWRAWIPFA
jgi:hypothetical protein